MMVRVQKSKEDGLDFSLALSFLSFVPSMERYPTIQVGGQKMGGGLWRFLVLSLEWGSLLFSRGKKKEQKN
jgi:hypothetical protein